MKSNLEPIKNKKIELKQIQQIALLSQALIIFAIVVSFIMSRYIIEFSLLMNIYLVILAAVMSYTNYSIYKRVGVSILYIVLGLIIFGSIILGIYV